MGKKNLMEDELRMMTGNAGTIPGVPKTSGLTTKGVTAGNAGTTGATPPATTTKKTGGNGGNGGSGGSGGAGTAAAAPSVQAAAQGSVTSQGPAATQTPGVTYTRPETAQYQESKQVQDAYAAMQAAQQGQPGAYAPSQTVLDAQAALQALQTSKPQGYTSKYQPQLDALLQQIQNPGDFKYEFNGDNLFKMYADEYTKRGKQASLDAMGQAAALTGGYGNSYAQQVANQAYDQNLTELYDRGMELYDRAYQKYLDDQSRLYDQYGLLNQAEQTDYERYRTDVGDWQNERSYLTDMYNNERNFDYDTYNQAYDRWMQNRNYATDLYNQLSQTDYGRFADDRALTEQQYQYDTSLEENARQFNEELNWDKMNEEQKYNAEYAMQVLAKGQMPSEAMLRAAGLSAEDAQKMIARIAAGGGGGSKKLVTEGMMGGYYETNPDGSLKTDAKGNLIPYDTSKGGYNVLTNPTNNVYGASSVADTINKVTYSVGTANNDTSVSAKTTQKILNSINKNSIYKNWLKK